MQKTIKTLKGIKMDKQKIFSNLNLFKGDSDTICKDASIWIDGNIIKYAGPSSEFTKHRII